MREIVGRLALVWAALCIGMTPASARELAVKDTRFLIDGKPVFLHGMSYYGALGASPDVIRQDLDRLRQHGFNWIRVWANWAAFENDVGVVDAEGRPREAHLAKLESLLRECERRGMIVDVSLSRGNGVTGPPRLQSPEAHRRAVEAVVTRLKGHWNWYLDLSNERNIQDKRHTSPGDLKALRERVRELDARRLVTASHAGDIGRDELREYLETVRIDFISPHRPRRPGTSAQTEAKTREYLGWMRELGRMVPVHYQEPFRRGYGWEPRAEDYAADLKGAIGGGAAGWCFHNGDQREAKDGRPRRSFDLRDGSLFSQLDDEEKRALDLLRAVTKP
jgi:hypothetical protein